MRTNKIIKLLVAVSFISGGAIAYADSSSNDSGSANASQPSVIDNQSLKFKLSGKLNDMFPGNNIEVTVFNGQVLLTGQVASNQIKSSAAATASSYEGVRAVKNYLTIGKKQQLKTTSNDSAISAQVVAKLVTVSGVDSTKVKVVTTNGVVYLLGLVSHTQATAIINNTKGISGVKKVVPLFEYNSEK